MNNITKNAKFVMDLHRMYCAKSDNPVVMAKVKPDSYDYEIYGVKFWQVGHNASHGFYLGVDSDDNIMKYAVDYDGLDEQRPPRKLNVDSEGIGYIGHW
jgi:hypothetical protein